MSSLQHLIEQTKLLKAKMQAEGQDALKEAFSSFFAAHPQARAIVWTQYTPYFNDGDACTFSVNEMELKVNASEFAADVQKLLGFEPSEDEEDEDDEDEDENEYNSGDGSAASVIALLEDTKDNRDYAKRSYAPTYGMTLRELSVSEKSLVTDFKELVEACNEIPEVLELILGDHVEIVATAKGFDVNEYEHD